MAEYLFIVEECWDVEESKAQGYLHMHHTAACCEQVLLVAGDTFRAAAAEQLAGWAERSSAQLISATSPKQRPDSLMYSAVEQVCVLLSHFRFLLLAVLKQTPLHPAMSLVLAPAFALLETEPGHLLVCGFAAGLPDRFQWHIWFLLSPGVQGRLSPRL